MTDLIPINIVIGDRTYRIKIYPKDEEPVRHAVKTINDKIVEFKTQFAGKDMQDYIAMVMIWYATQQTQQTNTDIENQAVSEKFLSLEKILDGMLEKG
jgi:cell division protein ZapA (FtsZ GTPase activity inhibitor)